MTVIHVPCRVYLRFKRGPRAARFAEGWCPFSLVIRSERQQPSSRHRYLAVPRRDGAAQGAFLLGHLRSGEGVQSAAASAPLKHSDDVKSAAPEGEQR